jgi:hypothetical protein
MKTSKVNAIHSFSSQKFRQKRKNDPTKRKNKKASKQHKRTQTQEHVVEPKTK